MSRPLQKRIMQHVADRRYSPQRVRELAEQLGVDADERDDFEQAIDALIDDGQIVLGSKNSVLLPPIGRELVGTFRKHRRGFGFVIPDAPVEHGDLFVPASRTGNALSGDRVRARVLKDRRGGREPGKSPYIGEIAEVVQRADRRYVGQLAQRGGQWMVDVDGDHLHEPVLVRDAPASGAKAGDKVVLEMLGYPDGNTLGEGVITEVLGESGEPDVETLGVMRAFGLPEKFDEAVLAEARAAADRFDPADLPADRLDLRETFTCTIDPPDARDYDDAISLRALDPDDETDGAAWELMVHIADVAYFVAPRSPLDAEARARGNSCYLPRRVVPMLPELLSNGVCSLQEDVPRLARTAILRYDGEAKVVDERFARTIIRSNKRLTYLEAQALIDDDVRAARQQAKTEPKYGRALIETLKRMDRLARQIRERRRQAGMIELNLPEVELVFDASGRVVDAQPEDDAFTHKIIEMFMVEANEAAARLFDVLDVPLLRRVHADPVAHDMDELRQFARVAGYNVPARPNRQQLQGLLDAVRGRPAERAVHLAVLQTLSKAEYAPLAIGHFALASEHYTHFTSPIRRYVDLTVHRALDAYCDHHPGHVERRLPPRDRRKDLRQDLYEDPRCDDLPTLEQVGKHCTTTEENAETAERELRKWLVLELLSEHVGETFEGLVTGVVSEGVFVQLQKYLVDGFVHCNDLSGALAGKGERWKVNRATGALVAQRSGRTVTIGDRFTVQIAKVDLAMRKLDLLIAADAKQGGSKQRKQPKGAGKAHRQNMKLKRQAKREQRYRGRRSR